MPTWRRKHSAGSHPLVKAMSGMSPSLLLAGRRSLSLGLGGSAMMVWEQAVMFGSGIWRRHLPAWRTSVRPEPLGVAAGDMGFWVSTSTRCTNAVVDGRLRSAHLGGHGQGVSAVGCSSAKRRGRTEEDVAEGPREFGRVEASTGAGPVPRGGWGTCRAAGTA